MPTQLTECLSCPGCSKVFNAEDQKPISLGCGHTVCQKCLINLLNKKCPNCQSEQSIITKSVEQLPVNYALLQLVGIAIPDKERPDTTQFTENSKFYESCKKYIEELAVHMQSISDTGTESDDEDENMKYEHGNNNSILSRPMQRKLVTLINSQLVEEEGRARAMRAARSLGERAVAELILQHQNPQQLSANLWAAVRARGCQFLGPAMQEEVLKLILLALVDGSALCRKVLVLFVVQKLEATYPQASKTAIGHVVQLLYRASCFKVTKKEEESSLMQLKEEFRSYESLRREHDSQIVQIAMEAGLRISPEQWSSLLYGDSNHKSHMQSIIDKLQTSESFTQSVNELMVVLQKTGDPAQLQQLKPHLQFLAMIDPSQDKQVPSWQNLEAILKTLKIVVDGLITYLNNYSHKKSDILPAQNARYKTSMCRDFTSTRSCPRGKNCSFAHSEEELERFRAKKKYSVKPFCSTMLTSAALTPKERQDLDKVNTKSTMLDIRNMASKNNEDARNRIESSTLKNLPATNVVKPMMSSLSTKTVCLTTDTTTSVSTTVIPSVLISNSAASTVNSSNISSVISHHSTPRIQPVSLQPEAVYYPPQINNRMPAPNQMYAPPPAPQAVRQPLTGAAARYPAQPYPVNLPYPPDQPPPCAHGYHNYPFDGQVPPVNYPGQWTPGAPGAAPFYMPRMTQPIYQDKYGRYQSMPPVPTIQPVQPSASLQNVVPPSVQQLPPGTIQPAPIPNQVNSLKDLQNRRQEILSHIHHNIQLTPSPSESNQPQYIARGAPITSQANRREKTSMPVSTNGAYSGTVGITDQHNMCNGLSQTEKAYTLLKKELYNNPQQAPDPRDLSWPIPPISVNAIAEFENQLTQSHPSLNSEAMLVTESQKSYLSASIDDDDFNSFCVSLDDDLETDGEEHYSQWSGGMDWSESSSTNSKTSCSSTISVDLFDWFEKQSLQYNAVQRMSSSEFIPFDPPIVSRFGPISRAARSKLKNSDPVIVTADEAIMKMTPVTAITPTMRPYPVTSPAPSRYRIPGQSIQPLSNSNTQTTNGEPHTLWHQHSNLSFAHRAVGGRQLHQELNRLEHNANEAPTQDERLAYELQAIELKISMRTGKRPDPIEQPDLGNIEPPANSAFSPQSQQKKRTALHMAAVEAQIERKDELSLRQHQEEVDRQLAEKLIMEELKSKK